MSRPGPARGARTTAPAVLLAGVLLVAATACTSRDPVPNRADRVYTTSLVEHHAQTLQILDLALGRPGITTRAGTVADATRREMFAEANRAIRRLHAWHAPVPATALEHHETTTRPHYDQGIPGMLGAGDLAALQRAGNGRFASAWLDRLVAHEEGAVRLARTELARGSDVTTLAVARQDLRDHRQRVAVLRSLRTGLR